jgi:GNAT superfamily N-acetyltransferase
LLRRSLQEVYVATYVKNIFQGFIVFYAEKGHVLLENVAVLPRAAGRGVGRALIGFCEDAARQLGMSAVRLYSNEEKPPDLPQTRICRDGASHGRRVSIVHFEKSLS